MRKRSAAQSVDSHLTWLHSGEACERHEINARTLGRLVAGGLIRVRRVPGTRVQQYHREDLDRIMRESVVTVNADQVAAGSSPAMAS